MEEKETTKSRLLRFVLEEKFTNAKFEKTCGLANGYLNSPNKTISSDVIEKVLQAFPKLNPEWLLTGQGRKIKECTALPSKDAAMLKAIQDMTDIVKSQQQTINRLITIKLQTERYNDEESIEA